jgi:hypothetical protein
MLVVKVTSQVEVGLLLVDVCRLVESNHKIAFIEEVVSEALIRSSQGWVTNLPIARNQPLVIMRITRIIITVIYNVVEPLEPFVLDHGVALGSLDWCPEVPELRKTQRAPPTRLNLRLKLSAGS